MGLSCGRKRYTTVHGLWTKRQKVLLSPFIESKCLSLLTISSLLWTTYKHCCISGTSCSGANYHSPRVDQWWAGRRENQNEGAINENQFIRFEYWITKHLFIIKFYKKMLIPWDSIFFQINNLDEDLSDGLVYKNLLEKLSGTQVSMPTGELVQVF